VRPMNSVIKPKRPRFPATWRGPFEVPHAASLGYPAESWLLPMSGYYIAVMSAVEVASDGDGIDRGPEYHLSVSMGKQGHNGPLRLPAEQAKAVLEMFDLEGAEEDNHVPNGKVRNFWRPVAEGLIGIECECKETEPVVREGDFDWRPAP
jgi:hypothetical protein